MIIAILKFRRCALGLLLNLYSRFFKPGVSINVLSFYKMHKIKFSIKWMILLVMIWFPF